METTQNIGEGLTFEKVWAAIQATNEQIRATNEQMKVTDEKIRATDEQIRATDEQMKVTDEKIRATNEQMRVTDEKIRATNEQMRATDKRVGELTNRFGDMVEHMVIPNLLAKFGELDFTFTKAARAEIKDREHDIFTEVDAFLENGDKVMIVEIKTKPGIDDINDHIERMEKLRRYADLHNDRRVYLGAVAGVVFGDSEKIYALKKGFYVIEPSGDTFTIIEPKGIYYPHEW
jgi:chromosome segregation ATPase